MKKLPFLNVILTSYILLFFLGCTDLSNKSDEIVLEDLRVKPRPTSGISEFTSNFDSTEILVDLFPDDYSGWTYLQLVEPNGSENIVLEDKKAYAGENSVELQDSLFHSDCCAIRLAAPPSGSSVSKAALQRDSLFFESGDDLWISAWFFIQGVENYQALFILDIETTAFQGGPGRRLMMSGGDNELKLESKSNVSGPEYRQAKENIIPFPKDEWVHIILHLQLSAGQDGLTEIWQDSVKIIEQYGQNLPSDNTVYDRVQIGITANGSSSDKVIYIDDVAISKQSLLEP